MRPYYIDKNLFDTSIYEIEEDDKEYKIKIENKLVVNLSPEGLVEMIQELRQQGEQATVYFLTGKKRKRYYKASI